MQGGAAQGQQSNQQKTQQSNYNAPTNNSNQALTQLSALFQQFQQQPASATSVNPSAQSQLATSMYMPTSNAMLGANAQQSSQVQPSSSSQQTPMTSQVQTQSSVTSPGANSTDSSYRYAQYAQYLAQIQQYQQAQQQMQHQGGQSTGQSNSMKSPIEGSSSKQ
jgi:beta-galactosidase GanA